jgi:hypothetical protein
MSARKVAGAEGDVPGHARHSAEHFGDWRGERRIWWEEVKGRGTMSSSSGELLGHMTSHFFPC